MGRRKHIYHQNEALLIAERCPLSARYRLICLVSTVNALLFSNKPLFTKYAMIQPKFEFNFSMLRETRSLAQKLGCLHCIGQLFESKK